MNINVQYVYNKLENKINFINWSVSMLSIFNVFKIGWSILAIVQFVEKILNLIDFLY